MGGGISARVNTGKARSNRQAAPVAIVVTVGWRFWGGDEAEGCVEENASLGVGGVFVGDAVVRASGAGSQLQVVGHGCRPSFMGRLSTVTLELLKEDMRGGCGCFV